MLSYFLSLMWIANLLKVADTRQGKSTNSQKLKKRSKVTMMMMTMYNNERAHQLLHNPKDHWVML